MPGPLTGHNISGQSCPSPCRLRQRYCIAARRQSTRLHTIVDMCKSTFCAHADTLFRQLLTAWLQTGNPSSSAVAIQPVRDCPVQSGFEVECFEPDVYTLREPCRQEWRQPFSAGVLAAFLLGSSSGKAAKGRFLKSCEAVNPVFLQDSHVHKAHVCACKLVDPRNGEMGHAREGPPADRVSFARRSGAKWAKARGSQQYASRSLVETLISSRRRCSHAQDSCIADPPVRAEQKFAPGKRTTV